MWKHFLSRLVLKIYLGTNGGNTEIGTSHGGSDKDTNRDPFWEFLQSNGNSQPAEELRQRLRILSWAAWGRRRRRPCRGQWRRRPTIGGWWRACTMTTPHGRNRAPARSGSFCLWVRRRPERIRRWEAADASAEMRRFSLGGVWAIRIPIFGELSCSSFFFHPSIHTYIRSLVLTRITIALFQNLTDS